MPKVGVRVVPLNAHNIFPDGSKGRAVASHFGPFEISFVSGLDFEKIFDSLDSIGDFPDVSPLLLGDRQV
jgi:hypothetical protein